MKGSRKSERTETFKLEQFFAFYICVCLSIKYVVLESRFLVSYGCQSLWILSGIDFTLMEVMRGEKVGLIGA